MEEREICALFEYIKGSRRVYQTSNGGRKEGEEVPPRVAVGFDTHPPPAFREWLLASFGDS